MVIPSTMSQRSDRVIYSNEPPLNFNTARDDAGASAQGATATLAGCRKSREAPFSLPASRALRGRARARILVRHFRPCPRPSGVGDGVGGEAGEGAKRPMKLALGSSQHDQREKRIGPSLAAAAPAAGHRRKVRSLRGPNSLCSRDARKPGPEEPTNATPSSEATGLLRRGTVPGAVGCLQSTRNFRKAWGGLLVQSSPPMLMTILPL